MKIILNPDEKIVVLTDDKGYLIDNFVVCKTNPHTLFIKIKNEGTISFYKVTFKKVSEGGNSISAFAFEKQGKVTTVTKETILEILPDEKIEQYHFIPNDFLKDYKY